MEVAQSVWLLGASTGGLSAIKQFLQQVSPMADIGFVYAQHIDESQVGTLMRMIKQTGWPVRQAVMGEFILPGGVTLIPPSHETRISKQGQLLRFSSPWHGHYAPSIDQLAKRLALLYKKNCGAIIFTGMGDDGAKGCQFIKDRGGKVWVQEPRECTASSMPESVIKRNCAQFVGTIAQLADKMSVEINRSETCCQ